MAKANKSREAKMKKRKKIVKLEINQQPWNKSKHKLLASETKNTNQDYHVINGMKENIRIRKE